MEALPKTVLVVEDDGPTSAFLADNLGADGYRVFCASEAGEAVRALEVRRPDLLLLDLGLESGSGLEVLDRLRAADPASSRMDPDLPVIILTGRAGEVDRVRGFARGADDYLCKPFSYPELVARIDAVLRRASGRLRRGVLRVGELTVDPSSRVVRVSGRAVGLSAKEFALLHALACDPSRVVSKVELLRDVWGYASIGMSRTVDAHACRLRKKLSCGERRYVGSVRGVGYRLFADGVVWVGCVVAGGLAVIVVRLRLRLELVARAEHELRGPLTAFGLALDAARGTAAGRRLALVLDAELARARAGLTDLAAARSGRRPVCVPSPVLVDRLLRSSAAAWGARVHRGAGSAVVRADPTRLASALGNVLSNAAEHGDGEVSVEARQLHDRVRIQVTNAVRGRDRGRGLGIAADAAAASGGRLVTAVLELPVER